MRSAKTAPVSADPLRLAVTTVVICALGWICRAGASPGAGYPVLPGAGFPLPTEPKSVSGSGAPEPSEDAAHRITTPEDAAAAPGWTVEPRVNVATALNDNIFQSSHRVSDFVTYITPEVSVRADTRRLQASIDYAPTAEIFASHSGEDVVAHNLHAYGVATLVEDALFLDLRGFAGVSPTAGGLPLGSSGLAAPGFGGFGRSSPNASAYLAKDNQTQSYSFSAAPYLVHRFADAGTLTVADRITQSSYSTLGAAPAYVARGAQTNSDLLTNEELAQFVTGPALGRVRNVTLADASQFYGNGVTNGAHQTIVTNQLGYAVSRSLLVFGELGYEDIAYPEAIPKVRIGDAVWAGGATLTPDQDSTITLGYGHRYGFNAAFLDASYRLTARTRVFARYQTGPGTDLQQLQGLIAVSGVDQFGNVVDSQTGAPLFIGNPSLAVQGNGTLNRAKTFTAGASTALDRDTVLVGFITTDQKAIAGSGRQGATNAAGTSARAISGNIVWQHELSETAQTAVYFGCGTQKQPLGYLGVAQDSAENFLGTLASYSYRFSPTLSGIAEYGYFQRGSRTPGRSFVQNIALVGVTKQF